MKLTKLNHQRQDNNYTTIEHYTETKLLNVNLEKETYDTNNMNKKKCDINKLKLASIYNLGVSGRKGANSHFSI